MACSARASVSRSACDSSGVSSLSEAARFTNVSAGSGRESTRSGKSSVRSLPARARCSVSSDGVALPSTAMAPAFCARTSARSRA